MLGSHMSNLFFHSSKYERDNDTLQIKVNADTHFFAFKVPISAMTLVEVV